MMSLGSSAGMSGMNVSLPITPLTDAFSTKCGPTGGPGGYCSAAPPAASPVYIGLQLSGVSYNGVVRTVGSFAAFSTAIVADLASIAFVDTSALIVNNVIASSGTSASGGVLVTLQVNGASAGVTASALATLRAAAASSLLAMPSLGYLLQTDSTYVNAAGLTASPFTLAAVEVTPSPTVATGGSGSEAGGAVADGSGGISDAAVSAIAIIASLAIAAALAGLVYKKVWAKGGARLGDDDREVSHADAAPAPRVHANAAPQSSVGGAGAAHAPSVAAELAAMERGGRV